MFKKLITACLAIAAFAAFVLPATASATNDPTLVEGAGNTPLAVGSKIVWTNIGVTRFVDTSNNALVSCSESLQTAEVIKNSGGTVEGTIETADFWGTGSTSSHNNTPECTGSFGNFYFTVTGHLCVRSTPTMATHEFQVETSTGTCTERHPWVEFVIGSTSIGACEYKSTGPIVGELVATGGDEVTLTPTQARSGVSKTGGFFCPSSLMLDMKFTLETHNGTAINVIDRP
jgi:hypothetical protein